MFFHFQHKAHSLWNSWVLVHGIGTLKPAGTPEGVWAEAWHRGDSSLLRKVATDVRGITSLLWSCKAHGFGNPSLNGMLQKHRLSPASANQILLRLKNMPPSLSSLQRRRYKWCQQSSCPPTPFTLLGVAPLHPTLFQAQPGNQALFAWRFGHAHTHVKAKNHTMTCLPLLVTSAL